MFHDRLNYRLKYKYPSNWIETYLDSFAKNRPLPSINFAYWAPKKGGWIVLSTGPNGFFDMNFETLKKAYDPEIDLLRSELRINLTYDPTNGTDSPGDVWRVKE